MLIVCSSIVNPGRSTPVASWDTDALAVVVAVDSQGIPIWVDAFDESSHVYLNRVAIYRGYSYSSKLPVMESGI